MSISSKPFKRVLITGGAGFVGRHLVPAALSRGLEVRVIDNFMASSPRSLDLFRKKIDFIRGDIRDKRVVRRAMQGMDAVFHLAAIRSVMKTVEDPEVAHGVNATGTLLLLEAARAAGVRHFIFTSTSSVYGLSIAGQQKESDPLKPISPYGVAKLAAELYANYYFLEKKLPTSAVRIFNVYGPWQNPESRYSLAVPGLLSKILKNQAPVIDGTGRQSRDFVYIGDVVDAYFKILGNPKAYGQVYNLGSGHSISINRITRTLLKLTGSPLKPIHGPRRAGDPEKTLADVSKAKRELGWTPRTSLEEGLRRTVEWYQSAYGL